MELFTGNGGVVDQLFSDIFTQVLVRRQLFGDEVGVSQFRDLADTVYQHDFLVAFVNVWVLDQAHERRQTSTSRKHVEVTTGQ